MKTVIGLFDTSADAHSAQNELLAAGISRSRISIVTSENNRDYRHDLRLEHAEAIEKSDDTESAEGTAAGIGTGALAGGAAGVLASLGLLAIPGIGGLLALGPIMGVIASAGLGAAAGGVIGGLVGLGIPKHEAEIYAEGIHRGGTLLTVEAPDRDADRIAIILSQHGAIDIDQRAAEWQSTGWTRQYPPLNPITPSVPFNTPAAPSIDARKRGVERKVDQDSLDQDRSIDMDRSLDALDRPPRKGSARIYHPQ